MQTKITLDDLKEKNGERWVNYYVANLKIPAGFSGTPLEVANLTGIGVLTRLNILLDFRIINLDDIHKFLVEQAEAFEAQEGWVEAATEYLEDHPELL